MSRLLRILHRKTNSIYQMKKLIFKQRQKSAKQRRRICATLIIFCSILFPLAAVSVDYVYLSDEVSIPLREGPDPGDKILKRRILSGTKLSLLESKSDANYIKVQTSKGEIGWLPSEFVVSEPPAKLVLEKQYEITAQLESQLAQTIKQSEKSRQRLSELESQKRERETKTETLEKELQAIKLLAAQTININQDNVILEQTNQRLRESVKRLTNENQSSSKEKRYLDFLIGGCLVLVGILVGALIKSRRRSSGWAS